MRSQALYKHWSATCKGLSEEDKLSQQACRAERSEAPAEGAGAMALHAGLSPQATDHAPPAPMSPQETAKPSPNEPSIFMAVILATAGILLLAGPASVKAPPP